MKKKLIILVLFIFFVTFPSFAKVNWVYDMQTAKAIALGQNKLIIIDFWATWCGPCKRMESKFWNSDKVSEFNDKFVFLKIDIDVNSQLARQFGVKGIPYVVVADVVGNKIWNMTGFQGGDQLLKVLKNFPKNVASINKAEIPVIEDESTDEDLLKIGKAYAEIGKNLTTKKSKKSFLSMSSRYFKKIKRGRYAEEAELRDLLNKAYLGHTKKLSKKVSSIPISDENKELRQVVLSYIQEVEK